MMNRRSFLKGILVAGVAPAAVSAGILMPVRRLWTPTHAMTATELALECLDRFVSYRPDLDRWEVVYLNRPITHGPLVQWATLTDSYNHPTPEDLAFYDRSAALAFERWPVRL